MYLAAAFLVFLFCLIAPADAGASSCAGRDLLAELKVSDPASYAAIEEKLKATPNGEGILWKIEGAPKPSYLFGTIHLADPRVTTLAPEVKAALEESERLAVEVADLSRETSSAALVEHAMVKEGGTLANLPAGGQAAVKAALTARGMPGEMAEHLQQWFLVLTLAMPPCALRAAATQNPDAVLDAALIKSARDANKPVIGLETAEEQIGIFKSIDPELIRRALILTPRTEPIVEDLLETMTKAWLQRRVAVIDHALPAIAQLNEEEATDAAEFQRALIDDRNVNMATRAGPELHAGGLFIAVGAGHLPGEKGLVELFRKAGFKLTRVW